MHKATPASITEYFFRTLLENRDLEAAFACAADGLIWIGAENAVVACGKAAAQAKLADSAWGKAAPCTVKLLDITECLPVPDCGVVTGRLLVENKSNGGATECPFTVYAAHIDGAFAIASVHAALSGERSVSALDYRRLTVALHSVYPVTLSINWTRGRYTAVSGGEYLSVNPAAEGALDDIVYGAAERMPPEYTGAFIETFNTASMLQKFASGVSSERMEYRQICFDERMHWLECVALRVDNAFDDEVVGIILIRLLDEQKAAEEALQQALAATSGELSRERLYQQIVDNSIPVGTSLFLLDDACTQLHVGGTMLSMLGYTREEYDAFQKRHLRGFVLDEDYGTAFQDMRQYSSSPRPSFEQEYRVVKKDGSIVWIFEKGTLVTIEDTYAYIVVCLDVTQRKEMEARLREDERLFRAVAAHSNRLIYRYDIAKRTAYADTSSAERAEARAVSTNMPESSIENNEILPESIDDFRRLYGDIHAGKPEGSAKIHMVTPTGRPRWVDMRYSLVDADGRAPTTAVISFQDITQTHERELAYERFRQMTQDETAGERMLFFETDLTTNAVEKQGGNVPGLAFPANGCRHEDAVGYGIRRLLPEEVRADAWTLFSRERLLVAFTDGKRSFAQDLPVVLPSGERCWFRAEIQMIRDPYTSHIKAYTSLYDVTEEITAALSVKKQAETDGMTGLYNKAVTEELVKQRLAVASGEPCCLLIADLDNLKSINDNMGHAQGDRAIRLMSDALRAQFRRSDIVGRIGGDEFLAFLAGAGNEAMLRGTMTALMRRLAAIRIGENDDFPLRGSIGIAFGKAGEDGFDELYRKADRALYHVKRNGKNDFAIYTPEMEETAYEYKGHTVESLWQSDNFERKELDRLLYAVSELYPLVISVNLTRNTYYMMRYNHYMTRSALDAGVFDDLVADGAGTFHPDDRASFIATFKRENLLAAHARGERVVSHVGRQLGDDKIYRRIRTDVIFAQDPGGDVMEVTLARELPDENGQLKNEKERHA